MRPYSPGGMLNALAPARQGSIPATPSIHRLGLGLPGYLIPFAPLAFAPQRQDRSRMPPSPPVFLQISTHFTATPGIPHPSPDFKPTSIGRSSQVKPGDFTFDLQVEREIPRLNLGTASDTGWLEVGRGMRNSRCSGEMRRYLEEHRWRRRHPGPILTLRSES